jgi:hypothetical protein
LQDSFNSLYQWLTSMLAAPTPADMITCGHVLNFWCLNFKREDHHFLSATNILVLRDVT